MTKTVDISGVFATNYPPLSYEADTEGITFRRDTMTIRPLAAEVREITVTATDALGQKASTTFTLNSRGLFQTVAAGEVRDSHYIEVDGKMVRTTLLEPEAVNHLLWSGDMTNPYWIASGSTVTGDRNEILIQESDQNQPHGIEFDAASGVSGTLYAEVKPAGRTRLRFGRSTGGNTTAEFDLDAVTATPLSDSTGARIVALDDGWYRIETDGAANGGRHMIWLHKEGEPNVTYLGDGASGVRVRKIGFGTANDFVPTYGAPATREAESLQDVPFATGGSSAFTFYARWRHIATGAGSISVGKYQVGSSMLRIRRGAINRYRVEFYNETGSASFGAWLEGNAAIGSLREVLMTVDQGAGTIHYEEHADGAETINNDQSFVPFATPRVSYLDITNMGEYEAIEAFAGSCDLAHCRANRGNLGSYRPGDPLPEGASSRASAALQNAPAPADLPSPPEGWVFAFPDEAYPGGRVPVRDHEGNVVGTVVQGVDDAVGTSDPTITREGWSLDGDDALIIEFDGDLDVPRNKSDLAVALTTADTKFLVASETGAASPYIGVASGAEGSSTVNSSFVERTLANGTLIAPLNRATVSQAWAVGSPVYAEMQGAAFNAWDRLHLFGYTQYQLQGTIHAIALHLSDTEATDESRAAAHAYVKARLALHGITLPDIP